MTWFDRLMKRLGYIHIGEYNRARDSEEYWRERSGGKDSEILTLKACLEHEINRKFDLADEILEENRNTCSWFEEFRGF